MDSQEFQMFQAIGQDIKSIREDMGGLKKGQELLQSSHESLIRKVDSHEDDDGAHGIKTTRWVFGTILSFVGIAVTCLEVYKMTHP